MKRTAIQHRMGTGIAVCLLLFASSPLPAADVVDKPESKTPAVEIDGAELFVREWIPADKRSHGGDGLGPLFNDSSCVACHNQGSTGGGGPLSKNVDILTAFSHPIGMPQPPVETTLVSRFIQSIFGEIDEPAPATVENPDFQKRRATQILAIKKRNREQLAGFHPGFSQGNSIVLHRNATYAGYQLWRTNVTNGQLKAAKPASVELFGSASNSDSNQSRGSARERQIQRFVQPQHSMQQMVAVFGNFTITRSQRNATALFGAGLIDSVKRETLEALAVQQAKEGVVSGRVALLKDNKVGRFGWKGQTASLRDFVLTACAVEVGLNVPKHPQSGLPQSPEYRPAGLDLNMDQCNALVEYVSSLPAPLQRDMPDKHNAEYVQSGSKLFASVGCTKCHVENVGDIKGVFSDLLLHDMGEQLGDAGGSYGIFVPDSTPDGQSLPELAANGNAAVTTKAIIGATRKEWRTAPLWGVRDSGPYLHDGRASDLQQAIAMHGGEAEKSATAYFRLSDAEKFQVATFLKSLVAPSADTPRKEVAAVVK